MLISLSGLSPKVLLYLCYSSLLLFLLHRAFDCCKEVLTTTLVVLAHHGVFLRLLKLGGLWNIETEIFSCKLDELFFPQQECEQKIFFKCPFKAPKEISRRLEAARKQYFKDRRHI